MLLQAGSKYECPLIGETARIGIEKVKKNKN